MGFEIDIIKWLQTARSPFFDALMSLISAMGESIFIAGVLMFVYFIISKEKGEAIAYSVLIGGMFNNTLKDIIKAPRPYQVDGSIAIVKPSTATGFSFPSGHTQMITSLSASTGIVFKKRWIILVGVIATVLVAITRMYLGAHFLKDTLVAMVIGVAFSFSTLFIYKKVSNKILLFGVTSLIFLPYLFFAESPDLFKTYGLLIGFFVSVILERKFVSFSEEVKLRYKFLRFFASAAMAIILHLTLKLIFPPRLFFDFFRYLLLTIISVFIMPLLLKVLKIDGASNDSSKKKEEE